MAKSCKSIQIEYINRSKETNGIDKIENTHTVPASNSHPSAHLIFQFTWICLVESLNTARIEMVREYNKEKTNITCLIANAKIIIVIGGASGKSESLSCYCCCCWLWWMCGAFVLNRELRYKSTRNQVQIELGQIFAVNPCAYLRHSQQQKNCHVHQCV